MSETMQAAISRAKRRKAERAFEDGIGVCGSVGARLQSLDCKTREEAVSMLAEVQTVRIFKVNGMVVVE